MNMGTAGISTEAAVLDSGMAAGPSGRGRMARSSPSNGGSKALAGATFDALGAPYAATIEDTPLNRPLGLEAICLVMGRFGAGVGPVAVNLVLENKTTSRLRIRWEKCRISDGGTPQPVCLESQRRGVAWSEAAPVMLDGGERIAESLVPANNVFIGTGAGLFSLKRMSRESIRLRIAYDDPRDPAGSESALTIRLARSGCR
jgi:hypothetical protein